MNQSRRPACGAALAALVALGAPCAHARAQETAADSARQQRADSSVFRPRGRARAPRCDGLTVSEVTVESRRPSFSGMAARWRAAARALGLHHSTTREVVVRRFLALTEGRPCTELRRSASERILRQQPYLASATVRTEPDGRGGARVVVVTEDEVPAIVGGSWARGAPSYVKLGSANVAGEAVRAEASWRNGFFYRDGFGVHLMDYQTLGRPYVFDGEARRDPLGGGVELRVFHPYYTDLQRFAWLGAYGNSREYRGFVRQIVDGERTPQASLSVRREFWNLGGVVRIGRPGRLSLFGATVSAERTRTDGRPFVVSDSGIVADTSTALFDRYPDRRAVRANALWGVRNVTYVTVNRFDALNGQQDMRKGFQFGAQLGRSISALSSTDEDFFVGGDLYMGGGSAHSFVAMEAQSEGRQGTAGTRWEGVLTSGRLAWYNTITPRHTLVTSSEYAATFRGRYPVQLLLGDNDGGVRGYAGDRQSGGARAVLRAEDRMVLGRVRKSADVGLAAFVDAGRLWRGDAPFGVTTPTRVGAGLGLIVAVPPRSKRTYRLDVGVPVTRTPGSKVEVRLTVRDFTRDFLRESRDISRARDRTAPTGIFTWP